MQDSVSAYYTISHKKMDKKELANYIIDITKEWLNGRQDNIEKTSATYLAKRFYIDRANISRMLNQLAAQELLLKINSRPVVFLSRGVLIERYPHLKKELRGQFTSLDELKKKLDNQMKPFMEESFKTLVNVLPGESLYESVRLIRSFLLKTSRRQHLLIYGQKGSGKRFVLRQLLQSSGYQHDVWLSQNDLEKMNYDQMVNLLSEHDAFVCSITDETNLANLFARLEGLMFPRMLPCIWIYDGERELAKFFCEAVYIPPYSNREISEKFDCLLSIVYEQAQSLNKEIRLTKAWICYLLSKAVDLRELANLIYSSIDLVFMDQMDNAPIFLDHYGEHEEMVSKSFSTIVFPEMVIVEPGKKWNAQELLSLNRFNYTTTIQKGWKHDFRASMLFKLLRPLPSYQGDELLYLKAEADLFSQIHKVYPYLSSESSQYVAQQLLSNRVWNDNERAYSNARMLKYCKQVVERAKGQSNSNQIKTLLSTVEETVTDSIPILLIGHQKLMTATLAGVFNLYCGKHIFYSRSYDEENINRLFKEMESYDRGRGVLVLAEKRLLERMNAQFQFYSKTLIQCELLESSYSIYTALNVLGRDKQSVISVMPAFLKKANDEKVHLEKKSLLKRQQYLTDPFLLEMARLFPNVNTRNTNLMMIKLASLLEEHTDISVDNALIYDICFMLNTYLSFHVEGIEPNLLEVGEDSQPSPLRQHLKDFILSIEPNNIWVQDELFMLLMDEVISYE